MATAPGRTVAAGCPECGELRDELGRLVCQFEPEQVLELACENDRRDAGREPGRHRIGDVFDVGAEPEEADHDHDRTRHQGGEHQPVITVTLHGRGNHNDERARRPADLHPAAAEQRHQKAADDRGVEPPLRPDADAIAIAIESGSATIATVSPASASARRSARP
jgi:hypothetical protein